MDAKLIIPVGQLAELIGAIGVYNGHNFREIQFQDSAGQRVEVGQVSITTDFPGLKIRTAPEDKTGPAERLNKLLDIMRGMNRDDQPGSGDGSSGSGSGENGSSSGSS